MGSNLCLQRALTCACIALAGTAASACGELLGIAEPFPRAAAGSAGQSGLSGAAGEAGSDPAGSSGQAGASATCEQLGATRCGGRGSLSPEICDGSNWRANGTINGGNSCPILCVAGECTQCASGETRCLGALAQRCDAGAWLTQAECDTYCIAGACQNPPSCDNLKGRACGVDTASCCQSLEVPGGSFTRDYDGEAYASTEYTATVSPFLLDRFEVSVGRFANFVARYDELTLEDGAGKSPHISGDLGWQTSMRQRMPETAAELRGSLACPYSTWTSSPPFERAINCVDYYVAYAFCVWDGGRLPTEAEWNYAAAGGDEQREYPWTTGPNQGPDDSYAFYAQFVGSPIDIGTKPKGNGRWGHSDLAGNVAEWVLDAYSEKYPSTRCTDCVSTASSSFRTLRGGGYLRLANEQKVSFRTGLKPNGDSLSGFRCARDIPPLAPNERTVNP